MAWPVLVFDIESIPDVQGLRLLRDAPKDATDAEVYAGWLQERKDNNQSDFMPLHLQRILVISCVFRNAEGLRVHSFVDRDNASEGKVVQNFFNALDKHTPQLVSWNGGGFDLPVLHYRGLRHGVTADRYWCMGEGGAADDREFKYNNYINRYHMRHMDLMDVLAMYSRAPARRWTRWPSCAAFPASWAWTAPRCTRPTWKASWTTSAATARRT
jgi:predicted PolB exonuclease-like 3'-5' exonuclease